MKNKVYLLGIGGIAMANLACLLKQKGCLVSGSDLDTFGPSAVLLKKYDITYFKDHHPGHIKKFRPDMVVIGNAMSRGNPSLEYVLNNQIPYCSMPEIIKTELLSGRKPIVITGTSGKTTTTALLTWILYKAGLKPTALVGGIMNNLNSGFISGNGQYVIIEGDEYNSSFYDLSPKFMHYQPYIGVINNIRADHLDIYGNIENILSTFKKFVNIIPSNGSLILNKSNQYTPNLTNSSRAKVTTFGKNGNIEPKNIHYHENGLSFDLISGSRSKASGEIKTVTSRLLGQHNIENILAASAIALNIGISFKKLAEGIKTFEGVKRRLEIIHPVRSLARAKGASLKDLGKATSCGMNQKNNTIIIDDFAHNPDKVLASLSALRSHFPKHQIVAIFEPRTGSSRRNFFQDTYTPSFKPADLVYVAEPYKKSALNKKEVFSSKKLVSDLNKDGTEAYAVKNADAIIAHIKTNLLKPTVSFRSFQRRRKTFPTIFCVMTSGDFDGIHKKLVSLFS